MTISPTALLSLCVKFPASFTPFLLIQLFALIIAWPLLQSDKLITQGLGLLIGISGLLGIVLGLLPQNRNKFI